MIKTQQAKTDDAEECAEILQEWIDETIWFTSPRPASAAAPMLRQNIDKYGFTLAMIDQQIAGFSCMSDGFLDFLYVGAKFRNRAVGHNLLKHCKFASSNGFSLWTFQQNTGARRFYEREGFVEAERTDGAGNEEGLPDIRYVWEGNHG